MTSVFFSDSEADASESLENMEEIFPLYNIHFGKIPSEHLQQE